MYKGKRRNRERDEEKSESINVTSSSSISYCSKSEHWSQKCTQNEKIHSIILDAYVNWQSSQNFPFLLFLRKLYKNLML